MTEPTIEVFADLLCPFTHVGLDRVVRRRAALGRDDIRIRVRAWPLEVINGAPMEAEAVAGKAADLRDQVSPHLFGGFRAETFPTTSLPALALANAAYRIDAGTGEAVSLELRRLTFDDGVDTSDPDVLAELAERHGIAEVTGEDEAAVSADLEEGRARGVVGSPHFFTPDGVGLFCPSLDIAHCDDDHYAVHFDVDHFSKLIEACFV